MPAVQAELLLGMFRASRRGEFAAAATELEGLLGRPATPVRSILDDAALAPAR